MQVAKTYHLNNGVFLLLSAQMALSLFVLGFDLWTGIRPMLLGVDLSFIFSASADELSSYYPNYGDLLHALAAVFKYGLPVLPIVAVILLVSRNREGADRLLQLWHHNALGWRHLLLPAAWCFALLLLIYLIARPFAIEPFQFQLHLTHCFLAVSMLNLVLLFAANGKRVKSAFKNYMSKNELPYSLAGTRILFGFFLYSEYQSYSDTAAVTIGQLDKVGLPFIGWLINIVPVNTEIYSAFCLIGIVITVFIILGLGTRFFLIINAIVVFYVVASPNFFGKIWHNQLIIWISWIMLFSPCADVWSIDSMRKGFGLNERNHNYGFHLKVIWLHFGLIYFFAGVHKLALCGLDWALTDSMVAQVQIEWFEHYDKVPTFRIDKWPVFLMVSGLVVILFEICYPFLLFGKRTKWISIVGGLTMHKSIGEFMYIAFENLQRMYLVFIPWNWILLKLNLKRPPYPLHTTLNWRSFWVLVPMGLLTVNFAFGVFKINSYPFSVYPIYAEIVQPSVKYFEYHVQDKGFQDLDVRGEGKAANFRWENYSRIEYYLIRDYKNSGKLDTAGVIAQWKRWKVGVPDLRNIDTIDVHIVERPLSPDESDVRLSDEYLMTIVK